VSAEFPKSSGVSPSFGEYKKLHTEAETTVETMYGVKNIRRKKVPANGALRIM
jgi:hypothetical protein